MKAGLGRIRCIAKINLDLFCQTAFNHTSTAIIPSTHIHTDLHIYTYTYIFYPLALQVLWVVTISLLELLLEWRYFVGKARSRKDDTADPQHALSILTTEKPSSIAHQAVCQSENWVYRPVKWVHLEKDGIDKEQYDSIIGDISNASCWLIVILRFPSTARGKNLFSDWYNFGPQLQRSKHGSNCARSS